MIKTSIYLKTILLVLFLVLFTFIRPQFALADRYIDDDLGLWINNNINLPITEKVQSRFQISPRLLDNITDFNQFILHSILGYKLNKNLSIWQGHAWSTTYIPHFRREQRIYQEVLLQNEFPKFNLENRIRLDERFIQDAGFSFRPRYRLKAIIPFGKNNPWSLVTFNELFINLTSSSNGPKRGIDQNRIFAGLRRKISDNVSVEGGYQLQYVNSNGPKVDKFNHFILLRFEVTLPQLLRK